MTRLRKICILGERVSGTCFVHKLIINNTDLKSESSYGHKHFFQDYQKLCKEDTSDVLFVFVTRDIISWLSSMKHTPYHADLPIRNCTDFSKFIRMEWMCIHDKTSGLSQLDKTYGSEMMIERDPDTGNRFENVIKMRTAKIDHCMALSQVVENFIHVRYEDVRDGPEDFIKNLSEQFEIRCKPKFSPITSMRGKGKVTYTPKEYDPVSDIDQLFILENLDECSETSVGYM